MNSQENTTANTTHLAAESKYEHVLQSQAQQYLNKEYVDYGDLNDKAEAQIKAAYIAGAKETAFKQQITEIENKFGEDRFADFLFSVFTNYNSDEMFDVRTIPSGGAGLCLKSIGPNKLAREEAMAIFDGIYRIANYIKEQNGLPVKNDENPTTLT